MPDRARRIQSDDAYGTPTRQTVPPGSARSSRPILQRVLEAGGTLPTDRWPSITGGSYRVGDALDTADEMFVWCPEWALITVRDPENGERVILDGNNRALQLWLGVVAGRSAPQTPITVVTGDLFQNVRFIAKALGPLWR